MESSGAFGDAEAGQDAAAAPSAIALEAGILAEASRAAGITLRLIGSLAISIRCPASWHLAPLLGRRPPQDIDFVGYAREEPRIHALFAGRGYELHPSVRHSREFGVKRLIYTHAEHARKVDIFLDSLVMAHTVDFRGRLEAEHDTVSLADLLLSKLQINRITENDLIDLVVLLAGRPLGTAPDAIDLSYISKLLASDWGFHHSALTNLGKLEEALDRFEALPASAAARVREQVAALRSELESAPKSTRWKLRARVGTRTPWFEHVDEVEL